MSILISSFAKGWQNQAQHEDMNDDALFKVVDLSFDVVGALVCRDLHSTHSFLSSLAETSAIGNVYVVDVEGDDVRRIYYTVGQTLYRWVSNTNTATAIATNVGTRRLSYAPIKPILADATHVYITNGNTMICDDGTDQKTWGIDPPDNVVTLADAGLTGNLSAGGYKYVYTFYETSTGAESNPSNEGAPLTINVNGSIDITGIQTSSNSRVNARRLYRTVANGGSYYLVATITDNITTWYTDHKADTDLTLEVTTDQGVPPTARVVSAYDDYLMLGNDVNFKNRLWFSRARRPDNFPSTYYINVGQAGNMVVNLAQFEEKLYPISRKGVSHLGGSNPDTFKAFESRAHVGSYAEWSVAVGPNGLYYLGFDGVYHYDGAQSKRISDPIMRIFGHTVGDWYDIIDKSQAPTVAKGVFLEGMYYLLVPLRRSSGETTNSIITYDAVNKVWNLYDVDCNDIFADVVKGSVYGAMQTYGGTTYTVYKLFESGRSSVDSPEPEFVTKAYDMTDAGEYSRAKKEITKGFTVRGGQEIGSLRKYRVDGDGEWTFTFYVDAVERHSETLSLSKSNVNTWHSFPAEIKGRHVYIRGVAEGSPTPGTCKLREIEIK